MSGKTPNGPRITLDRYYTAEPVADAIVESMLKHVPALREALHNAPPGLPGALEGHVGGGAFVAALNRHAPGVRVGGLDLDPNAPGRKLLDVDYGTADFRAWAEHRSRSGRASLGFRFPLIIGNPPFSEVPPGKKRGPVVAHLHVSSARTIGHWVGMITRVGLLTTSIKRREWVVRNRPAFQWFICPRPSFTGKGTDSAEYVFSLWAPEHYADHGLPVQARYLWWKTEDTKKKARIDAALARQRLGEAALRGGDQ